MFGDELIQASLRRLRRFTRCPRVELAPRAPHSPYILRGNLRRAPLDAMTHRMAAVILAIGEPGQERDGALRNHLADEDDASTILLICPSAHVEAQIHLVEICVEG